MVLAGEIGCVWRRLGWAGNTIASAHAATGRIVASTGKHLYFLARRRVENLAFLIVTGGADEEQDGIRRGRFRRLSGRTRARRIARLVAGENCSTAGYHRADEQTSHARWPPRQRRACNDPYR